MTEGRQRLDKWLCFARLAKSRTLAAKLIEAGEVRVNRVKADHAAQPVKQGDVLTLTIGREVRVLRVLAPGERRGPAPEARLLYEAVLSDLEPGSV